MMPPWLKRSIRWGLGIVVGVAALITVGLTSSPAYAASPPPLATPTIRQIQITFSKGYNGSSGSDYVE